MPCRSRLNLSNPSRLQLRSKHKTKLSTVIWLLISRFLSEPDVLVWFSSPRLSKRRSRGTDWIGVPARQPTPLSNAGHLLPKSFVSKTGSAEKISIINIPFNTSPAGQTVWRADSARWRMLFLSYMGGFCNVANRGIKPSPIHHAPEKWSCQGRSNRPGKNHRSSQYVSGLFMTAVNLNRERFFVFCLL